MRHRKWRLLMAAILFFTTFFGISIATTGQDSDPCSPLERLLTQIARPRGTEEAVPTKVISDEALYKFFTPEEVAACALGSTATATNTATSTVPTATPTPTQAAGAATTVTFPARGFFYYGWFAESWTQDPPPTGDPIFPFSKYEPTLGYYDSGNSSVVNSHVDDMVYAGGDVAITSWWGQDHWTNDHAPVLFDAAADTPLKVALYYEDEGFGNPTQTTISNDLIYLNNTFKNHAAAARINNRLIVFVYNADDTTCEVVDRWKAANASANAYLVMKVFAGYTSCAQQPDGWHQYGPNVREDQQGSHSFSIAPGFYYATATSPLLARDINIWDDNVRNMVASNANWQLIISFNEWGEGTGVESTTDFGRIYLDVLNQNGLGGGGPTPTPTRTPTPTATATPGGSVQGVIYATGDMVHYTTTGNQYGHQGFIVDAMKTAIPNEPVAPHYLWVGDIQYDSGCLTEYNGSGKYTDTYKTLPNHDTRVMPARGNHDNSGSCPSTSHYEVYFGSDVVDPLGGNTYHYEKDFGTWRLIVIDTNSIDSAEVTWLTQRIQAATESCIIVAGHHSPYNSGASHGTYSGETPDPELVQAFEVMYDNGVELYISGHDHHYERTYPLAGSAYTRDDAYGLVHIVAGIGGKENWWLAGTSTTDGIPQIVPQSASVYGGRWNKEGTQRSDSSKSYILHGWVRLTLYTNHLVMTLGREAEGVFNGGQYGISESYYNDTATINCHGAHP